MSNTKRTFDQLGVPGPSHSNKRPRSPQPIPGGARDPSSSGQPTNTASSPTRDPYGQLHGPTPIRSKSGATSHAILSTLKGSMKLLRKGCEGFTPLKSAAEAFLDVLDAIETSAHGSRSHALHNLASDLPQWAIVLSTYISKQNPEGMSRGIEHLAKTLREQAEYIREQQQSGKLRRLLGSEKELEELQDCCRRIDSAFQQLQDSQLNGLSPAHDARYDSSFSDKIERHTCFENTRVAVLAEVRHWVYSTTGAKIYWMNGMAGTGKTTIAFSVCAELEKNGLLGASFFCSRTSSECHDVSRILPTIAYQLAQYFYPFRCVLCRILGELPNIGQRSISVQFESLIQLPLLEVQDILPSGLVVVIDALDESSNPKTTEMILNFILEHTAHLPIRFLLTSRPEPTISNIMLSNSEGSCSILYLHNVEESLVQADIETYLTITLAGLLLPTSKIMQLAEQAGVLFIYAATVSRYIMAAGHRNNSIARLEAVLTADTNQGSKKNREIDTLYRTILATAINYETLEDHEVNMIQQVLWTVVCAKEPMATTTLADLLMVDVEQVAAAIQPLRSVVNVTQDNSTVATLHASFPDFLLSPERSKEFHCQLQGHNAYLATRCFWHMERLLRFNICDFETSFRLDEDVPDLDCRVDRAITPALSYACRYWPNHLTGANLLAELVSLLGQFLTYRFLFWVEVLSLKKWSGSGEAMLGQVVDWLSENRDLIELRDFAHDARNFFTTFAANPCSLSTPHIYISVLPFTPRESQVWRSYGPRMQGLIRVEGDAVDTRGRSALAIWALENEPESIALSSDGKRVVSGSGQHGIKGIIIIWNTTSGIPILELSDGHEGGITSVMFSPDDTRIASGSHDYNICIWDASNGELIAGPLQGHTSVVTSVAFSTDGTCLASGSEDSTIRMWDAYSGAQLGEPLKEHQGAVLSVAFSPNGKHLASSSDDHTIRIWDFQAGTLAYRPIEGHTDAVNSITYSRDGLRLVSGSADCTVRAWDMSDGTPLAGPFEGHNHAVTSVSFSPDGTRVVSGSDDQTIRVWEAFSGRLLAGPLRGHGDYVRSVLFTADGTRILSISDDRTIRVWDARQGTIGTTKTSEHTGGINSVALSPNSARVASGSSDSTICVWDTCDGTVIAGPFIGHTDRVLSVAFSPDGAHIVSGSQDHTLRVWDASTGALLVGPIEGHTDLVTSLSLPPNGNQIASGSYDRTIRIWNSHTGEPVGEPFRGHTNYVTSIAYSPNGARIVSGSGDYTIRMWDANDGTALWTSRIHVDDINCVAFSPDGMRIVSCSDYSSILVSDSSNGAVLHGSFTGHTWYISCVAFSPDGMCIVSGSRDKAIRVWDVGGGMAVAGSLSGHTDEINSVVFAPDGARIISGSEDRTIRIWDTAAITKASATSRDDWSIDESGWLTDSNSQRLFWVPADLRRGFGLLTPSNPTVINASCKVRIEGSTLLGDQWRKCYDMSVASVSESSVF